MLRILTSSAKSHPEGWELCTEGTFQLLTLTLEMYWISDLKRFFWGRDLNKNDFLNDELRYIIGISVILPKKKKLVFFNLYLKFKVVHLVTIAWTICERNIRFFMKTLLKMWNFKLEAICWNIWKILVEILIISLIVVGKIWDSLIKFHWICRFLNLKKIVGLVWKIYISCFLKNVLH